MEYFLLSPSQQSSNMKQSELFLAIILILLIAYIIYHKTKCNRNEKFMDMQQYNELMNGINQANDKAKYGYAQPNITPCGY